VQVGVRDFGQREMAVASDSRGRILTFFEADLRSELLRGATWDSLCRRVIAPLPHEVHVSWDVDGLSPDLCPHTGTPVPGGLDVHEAVTLLRAVVEAGRKIIGFDLNEVAPNPSDPDDEWDGNVGARVLYKLIAFTVASQGRARLL
jgi:agmatinase